MPATKDVKHKTANKPLKAAFDAAGKSGARGSKTGLSGKFYQASGPAKKIDIGPIIARAAGHPVLADMMKKLIFSESGNNPGAVSPTGARGLGQFVGNTLIEALHRHKLNLPAGARTLVEKNIECVNTAVSGDNPVYRCRVKEGGDKTAIENLAFDPHVAVPLSVAYVREISAEGNRQFRKGVRDKIAALEKPDYPKDKDYHHRLDCLKYNLERPLSYADIKTFYLCGPKGGSDLLVSYADTKSHGHRADDYTAAHVARANPGVFNDESGKPRSVADYMDYMEKRLGDKTLEGVMDLLSPKRRQSQGAPSMPGQ